MAFMLAILFWAIALLNGVHANQCCRIEEPRFDQSIQECLPGQNQDGTVQTYYCLGDMSGGYMTTLWFSPPSQGTNSGVLRLASQNYETAVLVYCPESESDYPYIGYNCPIHTGGPSTLPLDCPGTPKFFLSQTQFHARHCEPV